MPKTDCCSVPAYQYRGTLQTDTSTDDNPAESFTSTVADMPIAITAISGQESYRGRSLEARVDYVIETPYRASVTARQRILLTTGIYAGKTVNIEYVHPIQKPGKAATLELYCTELAT